MYHCDEGAYSSYVNVSTNLHEKSLKLIVIVAISFHRADKNINILVRLSLTQIVYYIMLYNCVLCIVCVLCIIIYMYLGGGRN